jgi:ABC-2 type transport system permease protein
MVVGIRILYNPQLKSQMAIIPGLVALILLLVAALQPSIALAREFELHTFAQLRLTPLTLPELLVGKLFPYVVLGFLETGMVLAIALGIFGVPMRGSWGTLLLFVSLFLLTAVSLGILFSVLTRNQQAAMQFIWLITFLPSFFLSDFIFPLRSMPHSLQAISFLVPARYFIRALRGIMLQGAGWDDLGAEALGLMLLTLAWMGLAWRQIRRYTE